MSHLLIPEYKVVMLGSGGVGKSMITTRYINGNFTEEYDPTIEDSYRKRCEVDDNACFLEILDTAGQEEYIALRDYHIRGGDCFVIVYSITNKSTLEEAEHIAEKIYQTKQTDEVPIVLVGNKCDHESERQVSMEDGKRLAKKIKSGFYEVSAKTGVKVDSIFTQCVRRIKHHSRNTELPSALTTARSSVHHSRESSVQGDKRSKKEKPKSSSKSWLPGRKSISKENAPLAVPASPPPMATLIPALPRNESNIPDYYLTTFTNSPEPHIVPANGKPTSIQRRKSEAGSPLGNRQINKGYARENSGSSSPTGRNGETMSVPPPKRVHYMGDESPSKRTQDTRSAPPPRRSGNNANSEKKLPDRYDQEDGNIPSLKRSLGTDTESNLSGHRIKKSSIQVVPYGTAIKPDVNKTLPEPKRRKKRMSSSCPIL
ncbi:ras family-domain-containing protein [Kickxella alabastrina]|uniref:ras family-domain-containing protein n=1 Tax=Kickxella alabastrina TaxID=61397 RepID=UPI00221EFAD2|nr:ras family-domain-containing protein [Kickxella alabastrina]KAI7834828.1 ras family-domain-containing protein [Kickxella alabastrina]KAJ1947132.1 hypothetical protein GGF37_000653 [Kickxella alabastrina]